MDHFEGLYADLLVRGVRCVDGPPAAFFVDGPDATDPADVKPYVTVAVGATMPPDWVDLEANRVAATAAEDTPCELRNALHAAILEVVGDAKNVAWRDRPTIEHRVDDDGTHLLYARARLAAWS